MLNQVLQLTRPLALLDLETTGVNPAKDRIIQIAIEMHYPDKDPVKWVSFVNPEISFITVGHSITPEMVKDAPRFADLAESLARSLAGADIMGHNIDSFDVKVLKAEFERAGIKWEWDGLPLDTLHICRTLDGHTLENAYKRYVDRAGFQGAHDAGNDISACLQVFLGQLKTFPDLPRTVEEIYTFLNPPKKKEPNWIDADGKIIWQDGVPCLSFGKWKGVALDKVQRGYFTWMIGSGSFSDEVILILGDVLKGKLPTKNETQPF